MGNRQGAGKAQELQQAPLWGGLSHWERSSFWGYILPPPPEVSHHINELPGELQLSPLHVIILALPCCRQCCVPTPLGTPSPHRPAKQDVPKEGARRLLQPVSLLLLFSCRCFNLSDGGNGPL